MKWVLVNHEMANGKWQMAMAKAKCQMARTKSPQI